MQKTFISFPDKPTKTQYDCILELNSDRKGLISQVYGFISNINPHSTAHLKRAWDTDLGVDLTEDQWDSILDLIHTSSTSALHGLIQMKVVHSPLVSTMLDWQRFIQTLNRYAQDVGASQLT